LIIAYLIQGIQNNQDLQPAFFAAIILIVFYIPAAAAVFFKKPGNN
jgi:hypothetical protein